MENAKKAKQLMILWICSYMLVFVALFVYIAVEGHMTGSFDFPGVSSWYQLCVLGLVVFYFLPLMFRIRKFARLADMMKLKAISLVGIICLIIWAVLATLAACMVLLGLVTA